MTYYLRVETDIMTLNVQQQIFAHYDREPHRINVAG